MQFYSILIFTVILIMTGCRNKGKDSVIHEPEIKPVLLPHTSKPPLKKVIRLSFRQKSDLVGSAVPYQAAFGMYMDESTNKYVPIISLPATNAFFSDRGNMGFQASILNYITRDFILSDSLEKLRRVGVSYFIPGMKENKPEPKTFYFDKPCDSWCLFVNKKYKDTLMRRLFIMDAICERRLRYNDKDTGIFMLYVKINEKSVKEDFLKKASETYARLALAYVIGNERINNYHTVSVRFYQNDIYTEVPVILDYCIECELFKDMLIYQQTD